MFWFSRSGFNGSPVSFLRVSIEVFISLVVAGHRVIVRVCRERLHFANESDGSAILARAVFSVNFVSKWLLFPLSLFPFYPYRERLTYILANIIFLPLRQCN